MSVTLSRSELDRMRASTQDIVPKNDKEIRKAELKKLSQDRLQHWPNTLMALRKKKGNDKKLPA